MVHDPSQLPPDLPRPEDDGACDHLRGQRLPSLSLLASNGEDIDPTKVETRWVVIYIYPRTGVPGVEMPEGWDSTPGARGCTPQSCAFRDSHSAFADVGAVVFGLSAQSHEDQMEFSRREHLPFLLLSDPHMALGGTLGLPTFQAAGETLYKRVTLIARSGIIEHVRYPVFPPDEDSEQVLSWLRSS